MNRFAIVVGLAALVMSGSAVSAQQKSRAQIEVEGHLKTLASKAKAPDRVRAITRMVELEAIKKGAAKDAIPAIAKAMKDKEDAVRAAAAEAIGSFGAAGYSVKEYVTDLSGLVTDTEKRDVKLNAIISLGHIGKDASPAQKMLSDLFEKEKAKDEKARDREMFQTLNEALQRLKAAGASSWAPLLTPVRMAFVERREMSIG